MAKPLADALYGSYILPVGISLYDNEVEQHVCGYMKIIINACIEYYTFPTPRIVYTYS